MVQDYVSYKLHTSYIQNKPTGYIKTSDCELLEDDKPHLQLLVADEQVENHPRREGQVNFFQESLAYYSKFL